MCIASQSKITRILDEHKAIIHHIGTYFKLFYLQYGNKPCNIFPLWYGMI